MDGTAANLSPMVLVPVLLPKVWGGRSLERLGKRLPGGAAIGESWELADLGATSASGAGGQAVRSTIVSGSFKGRALGEVVKDLGRAMMGDAALNEAGEFPLLVKYLDAAENLSVQVHPSPKYAAAHAGRGVHLKTESWYIIDAQPVNGAAPVLYIGLRPGVEISAFAAAARAQSADVVEMMNRVPATPGECHTLPSGTIHALGAGVVVAEVQTPSDTTFRLYDWGRTGRELHIEAALESAADPGIGAAARGSVAEGALCGRVATTAHYTIDEARPMAGDELTIGYACKQQRCAPFVLMILSGRGALVRADGAMEPMGVETGQTIVVPASIAKSIALRAGEGLRVLRIGLC